LIYSWRLKFSTYCLNKNFEAFEGFIGEKLVDLSKFQKLRLNIEENKIEYMFGCIYKN